MIKMWYFSGPVYHELKKEFKKIRDKHGFEWLGFAAQAWKTPRERIELIANRAEDDNGNEYTVDAYVLWKGGNITEACKELMEHFKGFEKKYDSEVFNAAPKVSYTDKKAWEDQTRHIIENMKRLGKSDFAIRAETRIRYYQGILRFGITCACGHHGIPGGFPCKCTKCGKVI